MASTSTDIPRTGAPATVTRLFGWGMLAVLFAFMINNILVVGVGLPGLHTLFSGGATGGTWLQVAIYVAALVAAASYVLRSGTTALRWDAHLIHRFNVYLIRGLFWSVLLVGIVDATIAFMRVEGLFLFFMSEDAARIFAKARWVGPYIHMPLIILGFVIAFFTRTLGFTWLALMVVVAELLIVISRFVFSYEQALMGDLVRYWYAALFLFASAYTLFEEGHVRVDVLYAGFGRSTRGFVNAVGSILLGMTTCWVIIGIGFNGSRSIINSPIANFEVSQTGTVGMFIKYQMAAFLGLFAITMLIQFVSYFFDAVADKREEPGHREIAPAAH
ncbi:TRAP transporter small permease subunit [Aliiroseovarius subalbicans]|uniref:TRAP transporter small permease subunit n=1 Tax=Aliiroseovarius subalbicans TaxID=2925840 RepID=UPI001F58AC81|nr:TRAP transporter small permease subunit [Aliiroseovarius subalbicans]MCI2400002.1 TRAP transporter small permease subunit [Aliiroseovarius subalbicans]